MNESIALSWQRLTSTATCFNDFFPALYARKHPRSTYIIFRISSLRAQEEQESLL